MRKKYFLIAIISLSVITVSCSNDDNFAQVVRQTNKHQFETSTTLEKQTLSHTLDNSIKPDRGGEDKDRDKKNGK